jgi:hypothetical protein
MRNPQKILDIVVLANREGYMAQLYLYYLKKSGFGVKRIIDIKPTQKNKLLTLLEATFGKRIIWFITGLIQANAKLKKDRFFFQTFTDFNFSKRVSYRHYTKSIQRIRVPSLNSQEFKQVLEEQNTKVFLFTGGGILGKSILNLKDALFIHIHPGIVPHIRGLDGLFWSLLLRGKVGMSCFFMDTGIDTGKVLFKKEYKPVQVKKEMLIKNSIGGDKFYKMLLTYYDPVMRAIAFSQFCEQLKQGLTSHDELVSFTNIPKEEQNNKEGETFFSMHKRLREVVIEHTLISS